MAVTDKFEVIINVNGEPAKEYEPPETDELIIRDPPGVIMKCIEAVPEAPFSIEMKIHPQERKRCDGLIWSVFLDGEEITWIVIEVSEYSAKKGKNAWIMMQGAYVKERGHFSPKRFEFANIVTRKSGVDELLDEETARKYSELGTIKVELWKADKFITYARPLDLLERTIEANLKKERALAASVSKKLSENAEGSDTESVPEKVLEGRGVYVSTGLHYSPQASLTGGSCASNDEEHSLRDDDTNETIIRIKQKRQIQVHHRPIGKDPLAKFIFRYRTKQGLRDEGIIPKAPPLEERPLESLSLAEALERIRRMEISKAEMKAQIEDNKRIKREASPSAAANPRVSKMIKTEEGNDIIDLEEST